MSKSADSENSYKADKNQQREVSEELREEVKKVLATFPARDDFVEAVLSRVEADEAIKNYVFEIARAPDLEPAHLRLAVWVAKDYASEELYFMDLINDGIVGLMQAVATFEGKGFTFREYCFCVVKEAVSLAVLEDTQSKRVPQYIIDRINSVKGVTRTLAESKGSEPTREEIAREMGFSLEELNRLINLAKMPVNVDI